MKLDRFRLQGFKSFPELAEVNIGSGLTGIVGPNGCGKSNLVEALKWAVGETSAKQMRAENGMEDLIFAGTQTRPPRNSAEVIVTVDNRDRLAPAEFNNADYLEVSRRMERGEGSSYKVNGRPALARDVQVLFKDAGIGAKSSALVSQGKVAAIINSKPSERKSIIDEAAGTSGLSSRRHEADMRLRGTEQNLEKAEVLEKGLSDQLASLRRQARQAARRREIDGLVRKAEATAFLVRWRTAATRITSGMRLHQENEDLVKNLMIGLQSSTASLAEIESHSAPLTKARSDAETALALARVGVDQVRREATAARSALQAAQKNAARTASDLERERAVLLESNGEYEDLKDQLSMTEEDRQYDAVLIEEASEAAEDARARLEEAAGELEIGNADHARRQAERKALADRLAEDTRQAHSLHQRAIGTREKLDRLRTDLAALPELSNEVEDAVAALDDAEAMMALAETGRLSALDMESAAKSAADAIKSELAITTSESRSLAKTVPATSLAAAVRTKEGFESALAIAIGDGMTASLSLDDERWWARSDIRVRHPEGSAALSESVEVPLELIAAVSGVGVAIDEDHARSLSLTLTAGQSVVTLEGKLWRWDGYRSSSNAAAAEEIKRASRLRHLVIEIERLEGQLGDAEKTLATRSSDLLAATAQERGLREEIKQRRLAIETLRRNDEQGVRRRAEITAQIQSSADMLKTVEIDAADAEKRRAASESELENLPRQDLAEAALSTLRSKHALVAKAYEVERAKMEKTRRDADTRGILSQNIRQKISEFDKRLSASRGNIAEFLKRSVEIEDELRILSENVELAPNLEVDALDSLEEASTAHEAAATAAKDSEIRLADAKFELRSCETQLAERREERARLLAEVKGFTDAAAELSREIADRLGISGDGLAEAAGVEPDAELPDLDTCEARMQRLSRERDTLGSVNLLADEQLKEVETKLGETNKVRDELREAVRRLRDSISKFDRERRERLTEAYARMDTNFQDLFSRLFRGGQAFLKLSGSDDILDAGLEIYAAPPGKKMQSMSLLSGGEQALTALALIFAAFLIRPAPVCVLDEVDAPLDDANVERLCSLVSDMAKDSTRFLVITHHALTMTWCDRLYGVTMSERGVSRLTSVDMEQASAFVESFTSDRPKD